MPTFRHGKGSRVILDSNDLSVYFKDASTSRTVDTGETTGFGSQAKTYVVGLSDATISMSGMFEATNTASEVGLDPAITTALASDNTNYLTFVPGSFAAGRTAQLGEVNSTKYEVSAPVGDVVAASVEFQCTGGLENGVVLAAGTTVSTATTTNGTAADNAASTANGGLAYLAVTANANTGSTAFKLQHSADNSTWADLGSAFTSVGASTKSAQKLVVASGTTVNRYVRAVATTANTGAITYTVAFARR